MDPSHPIQHGVSLTLISGYNTKAAKLSTLRRYSKPKKTRKKCDFRTITRNENLPLLSQPMSVLGSPILPLSLNGARYAVHGDNAIKLVVHFFLGLPTHGRVSRIQHDVYPHHLPISESGHISQNAQSSALCWYADLKEKDLLFPNNIPPT